MKATKNIKLLGLRAVAKKVLANSFHRESRRTDGLDSVGKAPDLNIDIPR